jgi:type IV pilus assembly protein PilV
MIMPARPPKTVAHQAGATLIEVLVSILLMALGVLAMAAMQVNAVQYSKTSEMRAVATLLANDLSDRMRANHPSDAVMPGGYNYLASGSYVAPSGPPTTPGNSCSDPATSCTFSEMAAMDLYQWSLNAYRQLPKGTARVVVNGSNADIWMVWTDPKTSTTNQAADNCPSGYNPPATVRCLFFRVSI